MKQRIMNHVGLLAALSILITFFAASIVMYQKYNSYMRQDVKNESRYLRYVLEYMGEDYLTREVGNITTSRITLFQEDGTVLFDSEKDAESMENHKNRPEVKAAKQTGEGEMIRISETLSQQTFYYAVQLDDGKILRVAMTTDSVLTTLLSSFTLMGILLIAVLCLAFAVVERQTKRLIEPINKLDLEHPLEHVEYEELRPLLNRVDEQNRQIAKQVEELKQAEEVRREFSANVSHELKTPLMSISGYAEIMKNGMVRQQDVPEFAGRIYDEASRLTSLVKDIIEISKLDEKSGEMPFEQVDIYELMEDICQNLTLHAKKRNVTISTEGCGAEIYGVRHILYEMMYNLVDNAIQSTSVWKTMESESQKKNRSVFLNGSTEWIKAIPGRPGEPGWGCRLLSTGQFCTMQKSGLTVHRDKEQKYRFCFIQTKKKRLKKPLLIFLPGIRYKQQQHGEDFQPASQHVKNQYQL